MYIIIIRKIKIYGGKMERIIGITKARNNIKEIIDNIMDNNEKFIITRDTNPEAAIISYRDYLNFKEIMRQLQEFKHNKALKNAQKQFREWLSDNGLGSDKIPEKEIERMIRELNVNNENN